MGTRSTGNLFVADSLNHRVQKLSPEGTVTTVAGLGGEGFGGDGAPATLALFDTPNGLAVAPDGSLYISDAGNYRVRRVDPEGIVTTVAGAGRQGMSGDGGPPLEAEFGLLAGLAFDAAQPEILLIADQSNNRARSIRF